MLAEKTPCAHTHTTLVQHAGTDRGSPDDGFGWEREEPGLGKIWFACHQCDECGAITQKEVTKEDLEGANDAPWLDTDSYHIRTKERVVGEVEIQAIRFMLKAARRS